MAQSHSIFGDLNDTQHWYALHTRSRHEKKVSERLAEKGVANYLPLHTTYRRWSDRQKKVTEPLFSCYVFVNIALRNRLDVLQTDGAVNLVAFNGIPAKIPEQQIEAIRYVLSEVKSVEQADFFQHGQKVRVEHGPLKGIEGTVVVKKNQHRLVIAIDAIHQAVSIEIDPGSLVRI